MTTASTANANDKTRDGVFHPFATAPSTMHKPWQPDCEVIARRGHAHGAFESTLGAYKLAAERGVVTGHARLLGLMVDQIGVTRDAALPSLTRREFEDCFDLDKHLTSVDTLIERALATAPAPAKPSRAPAKKSKKKAATKKKAAAKKAPARKKAPAKKKPVKKAAKGKSR